MFGEPGGEIITLTDAAVARVRLMLAKHDGDAVAVRLGVRSRGCSGMSYAMDFVDEIRPQDEVVEAEGVKVVIEATAVMFLLGAEMDYAEDKFQSGFTFSNPNAKGFCGCGESFHV